MTFSLRISVLTISCLLFSSVTFAQTCILKGTVTDSKTGDPLPYVNIGVKDQSVGTFTDSNGTYRLELPFGQYILMFSSVGFEKQERDITIGKKSAVELDVALKSTSEELNTIVVTSSKYAQKIQESISTIEVLKAKNLEISNIPSIDKAVDRMPGVAIVDNEPQIRAGSGFSSGLGSRVMIMVDEMPLMRGDAGRPDWTLLPIDDLDQIEVVKGASSVVYGSAAINGVINVRTAWPTDDPTTTVSTFLGMYSKPTPTYATPWTGSNPLNIGISLTHTQKFNNVDLTGGINYFNDQGYIGGSPENKVSDTIYNKGEFDRRIKAFFNSRVRSIKVKGLSYGLNGNFMYDENATAYFWYDADTNIYRSFPGSLSKFSEFTFYVDPFIKYYAKDGSIHSFKNRVYYLNSEGLYNQSSLCVTLYDEYQYTHKFKKLDNLVIVTGIANTYTYSFGKVFSGELAANGTPTLGDNGTYTAENFAVYLQLEKKFFKRLTFLLGGRYEYYNLADLTERKPIFRAGLNLEATKSTFLRASVGQGYRVPSIGERYITTTSGNFGFYPNPTLVSEESLSFELGAKQLFKVGSFVGFADVSGFYEDYNNYVEFNFGVWGRSKDPSKNLGFMFFNTGPAKIYGIDGTVSGEGKVAKDLTIGVIVGYTYAVPKSTDPNYVFYQQGKSKYTYLTTSSDTNGYILKYRVQTLLKADLQVTWKRFSTGFTGRYYGFMKNIDRFFYDFLDGQMFGVNTGIKKYREDHNTGTFIMDYRLGYNFKGFKFSLIVNNLLDTQFSLRPLTVEPPRLTQLQVIYKI
jgi:outer membrane cobalamin receptor